MNLGLIGYGSIATGVIARLSRTQVAKITVLVRHGSRSASRNAQDLTGGTIPVRFVFDVTELIADQPDLVVECAGHSAVADHVPGVLAAGFDTVIASIGALAEHSLAERLASAQTRGASRLILPSGAIGGLDLLRAVSLAGEVDVTYRGTKPPNAWIGSPAETLLDLASQTTKQTFFSGTGREAALMFPKNANVVAALALAGAGFDRMRVELISDPDIKTNQHAYEVVSSLCTYSMQIAATNAAGNARTSATTVMSILHEILNHQSRRSQRTLRGS